MRRKTRRNSNGRIESIDGIIAKILAKGKLGDSAQVAELWRQWREIVGDDVAEHCVPEKISDGRLYVKVDSPVWHQQLDLMKEELKEKIDGRLGDPGIEKIVFRSNTAPG